MGILREEGYKGGIQDEKQARKTLINVPIAHDIAHPYANQTFLDPDGRQPLL